MPPAVTRAARFQLPETPFITIELPLVESSSKIIQLGMEKGGTPFWPIIVSWPSAMRQDWLTETGIPFLITVRGW